MNAPTTPSLSRTTNLTRKALEVGTELLETGRAEKIQARKLAELLGVSVGTFYNLFGTMEAYQRQLFSQLYAELLDILEDRLAHLQNKSTEDRLNAVAQSFYDVMHHNLAGWRSLFAYEGSTALTSDNWPYRDQLIMIISEALFPSGKRPDRNGYLRAETFYLCLRGIFQNHLQCKDKEKEAPQTSRQIDLLIAVFS